MERIEQLQTDLAAARMERARAKVRLQDAEAKVVRMTNELLIAEEAAAVLQAQAGVQALSVARTR